MTDTQQPTGAERPYHPRGFWALVVTQFQGAFNDNVYQWVIVFSLLAIMSGGAAGGELMFSILGWDLTLSRYDYVSGVSRFLFSLPFIIFPSLFGALADRYSKGRVSTWTKFIEVGIMIAGGIAFMMGNPFIIWGILFLMATQSAMFGPAKYGIMPEIVPEQRLSWANGIIQMGTIVAVILGVWAAGELFSAFKDDLYIVSMFLVALSILGLVTSFFITRPEPANPAARLPLNPLMPWAGMGRYFRAIWSDRILLNVVIGYVYFWFAGSLVQQNLIKFGGDTLQLAENAQSALLAAVGLGIGFGALAAGFLSRGKIEMGLVPIGALGMAIFAVLLAIPQVLDSEALAASAAAGARAHAQLGPYFYYIAISSFGLGFFAGIFDVPLAAAIQHRAPRGAVGGVIATTNMLTFVGMAFSGILFMLLGLAGLSTYQVFLVTGVLSLAIGVYIVFRLPHLCLRAGLWFLANTAFRVRVAGREHLPDTGAVLFTGTHISFIDCLAFFAATDRDIHFVMREDVYQRPLIGRLARMMRIIPVKCGPTEADQAAVAQAVRDVLATGGAVCVNNERRAEPDGALFPWADGYAALLEGLDVTAIPFYASRTWQSLYIFEDDRFQWRLPKRIPYPVDIRFGAPLPADCGSETLRKSLQALGNAVHTARPLRFQNLHHGFVKMARRNLRKVAVADVLSGQLNYFKALVGCIVFARKLRARLDGREIVGVLLPPSVGGVLANTALSLLGRIPVNLNYTANNEMIASCASQCNISQVLTSRKLLERLPLEVPGEAVFLEDIKETVTGKDRLIAILLALLCPIPVLDKLLGAPRRMPDDLATIIFSSGSEGDPKGVMLTHRNIMTNIDAAFEVFPNHRDSCLVGFLPFFHSFGYMATLWLPLIHGLRGAYHANPLEPKIIGKLIEQYRGTIMIGTSTLLQGFIRRCEPDQLASLEFVVCGAEKLAPRVRLAFKERFGIEPLEGYGTTECAPAVAANIPDCISPGFYSPGTHHGSIGRPIPGQEIKIVDSDTGAELPPGQDGLLLVRGPNIMQGYLGKPEKTASVLKDGWYTTGDIAHLDEDGFITITDRLARFSKIGGEMVPHTKVEETLHGLLDLTEQRMAVTSVPDPQKGERLVVFHTLAEDELDRLLKAIPQSDIPNLWAPRASSFHAIAEIPVLGTGKMDIKTVKKMAQEMNPEAQGG
ncbi:MAG: MFS transporter [Candidatus Hydrogenedentes bacterium]|nr:MFS transporter [Candidatus Hydrogenedentota bacterium]